MSQLSENYLKLNPLVKNIMRTYKRSDYKFENVKSTRKNPKIIKLSNNLNNKNSIQESLMKKAKELNDEYLLKSAQKAKHVKSSTVSLVASVKEKLEKMPSFSETRSAIASKDYRIGMTRAESNKFSSISLGNKSIKKNGKISIENKYAASPKKTKKILIPEKTNITFNNLSGSQSFKNLHTLNKTSAHKLLENSKIAMKFQKSLKPNRVATPRTPMKNFKYQINKINEVKAFGLEKSTYNSNKILAKAIDEQPVVFRLKSSNMSSKKLDNFKQVPFAYFSDDRKNKNGFVEYFRRTRNLKI